MNHLEKLCRECNTKFINQGKKRTNECKTCYKSRSKIIKLKSIEKLKTVSTTSDDDIKNLFSLTSENIITKMKLEICSLKQQLIATDKKLDMIFNFLKNESKYGLKIPKKDERIKKSKYISSSDSSD